MTHYPVSILLIDDNPASRAFLGAQLAAAGAAVQLAGNAWEGIAALRRRGFDLVLVKLSRPGRNGAPVGRFARRFARQAALVNLQPEAESAETFDLTLSAAGEIHYFFAALRYLAGPPRGEEPAHFAEVPS